MQDTHVASSAKRQRPWEDIPMHSAAISHHTLVDDDDETGTTLRGGELSSDHVLEPIIVADVDIQTHLEVDGSDGTDEVGEGQMNDEDAEDWEAELDDGLQDSTAELKDWTTLCTQIKTHMKKHSSISM